MASAGVNARTMRRRGWPRGLLAACVPLLFAVACNSTSLAAKAGPNGTVFDFPGNPTAAQRAADLKVMQRRAAALGGSAELVGDHLIVKAPGGRDVALRISVEGHVGFRPVEAQYPATGPTTPAVTPESQLRPDTAAVMTSYASGQGLATVYQVGPEGLSGLAIASATADEAQDGTWEVRPVLKAGTAGIDRFDQLAAVCAAAEKVCPTHQVALSVDAVVLAAPTVQSSDYARDALSLSGAFTQPEAQALAAVMGNGELATPILPHALPAKG